MLLDFLLKKVYFEYRIIFLLYSMAKILDKDNNTILVKFTISEYQKIADSWLLSETPEDISEYEMVFDTAVPAADLLKSF